MQPSNGHRFQADRVRELPVAHESVERASAPIAAQFNLTLREKDERKGGSPGRTRTSDQLVNSQPLYLLSYRGSVARF